MADRLLDFGVNLTGVDGPVAKLGLAADRVGDLRPVWNVLHAGRNSDPLLKGGGGKSFVSMVAEQYRTKGRRGGTPWPGYDGEPVYKIIKVKFGGGLGRMLRWRPGRERLYPSLISPGHAEHIYRTKRHEMVVGTAVPYAVRHQRGIGVQPFDNVPLKKRPLIVMTRNDFRGWIRAIQRHVAGTVGIASARARQLSR